MFKTVAKGMKDKSDWKSEDDPAHLITQFHGVSLLGTIAVRSHTVSDELHSRIKMP